MRLFAFVSALSLASSVFAHAQPENHAQAVNDVLHKRQSGGTVFVTGPGGNVQPRLEIRQMKDNFPEQYDLLILAMEQWKKGGENVDTSYYGVSSIHGVPRQDWNGVSQCPTCGGSDGYCPHDSILFPGWHRAYVALFEQEFLKIVKQIAQQYPAGATRTKYVNAANIMRWPYWDWAAQAPAGRPHLPKIISDYTCTVNAPSGQRTLTPNPLFRYDFSNPSNLVYSPFTTWTRTYRYPNSNSANAASNTQACINAFENIADSLQDQIYQLFTTCKDYLHFSNDDAGSSSTQCRSSLEAIHNTVHNTAGGPGGSVSGGHMTYLPLGSFDPIFWLHHANVDRIFAMWQTLNPNALGGSQVAPHNTWTVAQGSTQGTGSPLLPFRRSFTSWWTTNDLADWTVFSYTYPEYTHGSTDANTISGYVNRLYGPNANAVAGSSKRQLGLKDGVNAMVNGIVGGLADALPSNPLLASNGSAFEYFANIETPRYALNGSYAIYLFNGKPVSEDPTQWVFDQNLIGPMGVMAQDGMMNNKIITSGSIPLTRTLQKMVGKNSSILAGLTEALVVPFLTKNLEWRIAGPGGESVDPGTLDGFVVSVVTSTAARSQDQSVLPTFSQFIDLPDITKGQAGGQNDTSNTAAMPATY